MGKKDDRLYIKNHTAYMLTWIGMIITFLALLAFQCISIEPTTRFYIQIVLMLLSFSMNVVLEKMGFYFSFVINFTQFLVYTYEYTVLKKEFSLELIVMTLAIMIINLAIQTYVVKISNKIYAKKKNELRERSKNINKELENDLFNRTHLIVNHESMEKNEEVSEVIEQTISPAIDPLTTLPSRDMITQRIDNIIADDIKAMQNSKIPDDACSKMVIIYLALKREEFLTHNIGHRSMDLYIQSMAHRIREAADHKDMVARVQGSEFVIMAKRVMNESEITSYVNKLINAGKMAFQAGDEAMDINFSAGVSRYPEDSRLAAELITLAEQSMAVAAEDPSITLSIHSSENTSTIFTGKSVSELVVMFENAISEGDIYMVYQPCFTYDKQLIGFEALLRWRTDDGDIKTNDFLTAAEKCGYTRRIGNYSISKATEALKKINDKNSALCMHINISSQQLKDPTFTQELSNSISNSGCNIRNLVLDVSEESLYTDLSDIKTNIEKINTMGVKIALDNFGRGYSSFNTIPLLPISILKLDSSFIKNLPTDINSKILSSSVISIMHDIDIKVYATGVENDQQMEILSKYGCDIFQGNYNHLPISEDMLNDISLDSSI